MDNTSTWADLREAWQQRDALEITVGQQQQTIGTLRQTVADLEREKGRMAKQMDDQSSVIEALRRALQRKDDEMRKLTGSHVS